MKLAFLRKHKFIMCLLCLRPSLGKIDKKRERNEGTDGWISNKSKRKKKIRKKTIVIQMKRKMEDK